MAKFKVGDSIEIVQAGIWTRIGDVGEITYLFSDGSGVRADFPHGKNILLRRDEFKLINHQCITALEKEIAKLRPLKEKVEHLEQAVQQYFTVSGEPSTVNEVSNIYRRLVVKNVKQLPEAEKLVQEKGLTREDMELILSTFKLRDEKSPQVAGTTSEENKKTASPEVNDFQKLFSVLEEDHDLGVIELPSYVFDLPDSYKERVFKIYQILRDGKTPNVYAYAILDMVRAAFDLTER